MHAGFWHDGEAVLQHISKAYPNSQIYLVGFSAGSNIVHKLLRRCTSSSSGSSIYTNIVAGMSVCISQDYKTSRDNLELTTAGKIYSMMITLMHKVILDWFIDWYIDSLIDSFIH